MYAQKWTDIRISQSKDQHIAKNTKSDTINKKCLQKKPKNKGIYYYLEIRVDK